MRSNGSLNDRYEWKSFQQEVEIENFSDKLFGQSEKTAEQDIDLPDQFVSLANKRLPATSLYPLNYLKSR